jgi:hypothetical protein
MMKEREVATESVDDEEVKHGEGWRRCEAAATAYRCLFSC